ncbi:MAG TPA: hypothetical protein VL282_08445 [Tepidisphaeraceae bacterium]|jgi:hypothetical protein|nr:hypothetical protein [Tepidisphaeraceae bacterium]
MLRLRHFAGPAMGFALAIGVAGCAATNENIPSSANMVSSGNETVAFTAPRDGKVYVLDKNMNKLLYSGNIERGQAVTVDPTRKDRNIALDGNSVTQTSLNVGHTYEIFFQPNNTTDRHVTVEEHTYHDHDRL